MANLRLSQDPSVWSDRSSTTQLELFQILPSHWVIGVLQLRLPWAFIRVVWTPAPPRAVSQLSLILRQANQACSPCGKRVPHSKSGKPQDQSNFQESACVPLIKPSHVAKSALRHMAAEWSVTVSLFLLTKNFAVSK